MSRKKAGRSNPILTALRTTPLEKRLAVYHKVADPGLLAAALVQPAGQKVVALLGLTEVSRVPTVMCATRFTHSQVGAAPPAPSPASCSLRAARVARRWP